MECGTQEGTKTNENEGAKISSDHIQIKADKKEITRRITAFIKRKRMEVDELNVQEFCNRPQTDIAPDDSCARVDAIVVKRTGGKSHIKVSRVVNQWGPQTQLQSVRKKDVEQVSPTNCNSILSAANDAINERLQTMETHLKLNMGRQTTKDIHERLRDLENRILFLEGISPDYFDINPRKLQKMSTMYERNEEEMSLTAINSRIRELKDSLLRKQGKT